MQRKHSYKFYLKWILSQYKEYKGYVLLLLLFTVISTLAESLYPMVIKSLIDSIVKNLHEFSQGNKTMEQVLDERNKFIVILLLFGIGLMFSNVYSYLRGKLNLHFEIFLRNKYFKKILQKSYRFFIKFRTGDIATRLTSDLKTHPPGIPWFLCSGIFRAFNSTCIVSFCLFIMFSMNVKLTLISLIPIPFIMIIFFKLEARIESIYSQQRKKESKTNDFLEAAYSGIKIVKSFNSEKFQKDKFKDVLDDRYGVETEVIKMYGMFHIFFTIFIHFAQVLVLLYGGIMVLKGNMSIGTYFAFYTYLGMIVFPLIDIPQLFVTGSQAFVTIDRLEELMNYEKDNPDDLSGDKKIVEFNSLSLENVNFSFDTEDEKQDFNIKDINLSIKKGEKVAIVGKIASGKTTLLNLITGIYSPDKGNIKVNGINIKEIQKDNFRNMFGYIQQDPSIFSESIYTNIDFWRNIEKERIISSTKIAQFDDEVNEMPEKYDQLLGQKGIGLSGGQRQRLSISRALSGKPTLIIMDDVTSALDAENEERFWKDLNSSFKDVTCIIVTHRISTAQNADRIIVIDSGTIEDQGTHNELVESSDVYKELINN